MEKEKNTLNELLKCCIGREISTLIISKIKIFPNDNGNMKLSNLITEGFFNITSNDIQLMCLGIRDINGSFTIHNYSLSYIGETIKSVSFDEIQICFKI